MANVHCFLLPALMDKDWAASNVGTLHSDSPVSYDKFSIASQAEYFGFGIALDPARLDPVAKEPVESAVRRVYTDPSYKVGPSTQTSPSGPSLL